MSLPDIHSLAPDLIFAGYCAHHRAQIRASTLNAACSFFDIQHHRKFIINEHHRIICEALDKVLAGDCTRLIINIAPRYSKTQLAVKTFIGKGLAHNPAARFIHLSYSKNLALDNSEEIKDLVTTAEYQAMFPQVKIKKDSKAKNKWYTTKHGGVYATATGGQVTGFGAGAVDPEAEDDEVMGDEIADDLRYIEECDGFGGALIIDDPVKPEDADSDLKRERINQRFDNTIRSRVNSRRTPIIIVMQRTHPDDLVGYLLKNEPGVWTVISLPAIQEDGTALWPHKHTLQELYELKEKNEVVFETQYQQNPEPKEGLLFPKSELHYYNPKYYTREPEFKYMAVDPADDGGDDNAAPMAHLFDDRIMIYDVIYNTHGTDFNIPRIVEAAVTGKFNHVEIEGVSGWKVMGKDVRTKIQDRYPDCEVRIIKATTNKVTRIVAMHAFIKTHCYFLEEQYWTPEYRRFMTNLTAFMRTGKNKHDDAADAMTILAVFFQRNFSHLWGG